MEFQFQFIRRQFNLAEKRRQRKSLLNSFFPLLLKVLVYPQPNKVLGIVNVLNLMSIVKYDIHTTYQLTSVGINQKKKMLNEYVQWEEAKK